MDPRVWATGPRAPGKGGVAKQQILPDRMARGLDALMSMRENLRNYRVEEVHVVATSAMRDAKNGADFCAQAKELAGLDIQVISGPHEARLIQEGVTLNFTPPEGTTCLTMDIGGGSVEFIVWNAEGIQWAQSFDAGVARLAMLMQMPDPMEAAGAENDPVLRGRHGALGGGVGSVEADGACGRERFV